MVVLLVALTFLVAIVAKAIVQPSVEKEWMVISPKAMVPEGMRA
ncbi:MAG: hypothetical protein N3G78_07605 [Desulfobacterota bacterium]|nr:hypothetical protein [Thermodesulfobacteriota bacterium]